MWVEIECNSTTQWLLAARTAATNQSVIEAIHTMRKRQVRYNSAPPLAERFAVWIRGYATTLFICRQ